MSKDRVEHTVIRPFGPPILKFQMPQSIVDSFNNCVDEIDRNNMAKDLDHSDNLAGKVSEELTIPHEVMMENAEFFFKSANEFVEHMHTFYMSEQSDHHINGVYDEEKEAFVHQIASSWFVRSYAGDYNPVHMHPGIQMASFGYLKLPDWDSELGTDEEDHFGLTHGCTQFSFGSGGSGGFTRSTYTVKPKVGDFYLFPAWLYHCVYPFRSEGERRSFAINFRSVKVNKN